MAELELYLLGEPHTRRTGCFLKAADSLNTKVHFRELRSFDPDSIAPALIKIDPISSGSYEIEQMEHLISSYREILQRLSESRHCFYNTPAGIASVLDKKSCKEQLVSHGVPTTQMLTSALHSPDLLKDLMAEKHLPGVFIKPRYGSAAAGILAYRFHPKTGRETLYSCAALVDGRLVNTRTLRKLEDPEEISPILSRILSFETIVERWHPKAKHKGFSYDLRAVMQFGRLDFLIARYSKGPITNLQLNNGALPYEELRLPAYVRDDIERLCHQAMEAFPELSYAGIDILLSADLRPCVIEINGQGDLLYQDIFKDNRIYKNQILYYLKHGQAGPYA